MRKNKSTAPLLWSSSKIKRIVRSTRKRLHITCPYKKRERNCTEIIPFIAFTKKKKKKRRKEK